MNFKFIHVADLHLGSPFLGVAMREQAMAMRFLEASRAAFTTLVSEAIERQVAFVVIAGDVYDGDWRDMSIGLFFNRELSRLDKAGIPAYITKGNHDAESVITKSVTLPKSVHVFSSRKPETFRIEAVEAALHGRSFPHRDVKENLAASYPAAISGWFNIGVLHTSLAGIPGQDNYAPCTITDLRSLGYQYWALGHIHEYEIISRNPWVVFSGNLQGRDAGESGPRGAVLVTVGDGEVMKVDRLIVDRARWVKIDVDLSGADTMEQALDRVEAAALLSVGDAEEKLFVARVHLHGATALYERLMTQRAELRDQVQAALDHVGEDVQLEKLIIDATPPPTAACDSPIADSSIGLDGIDKDPAFRRAAEEAMGMIGRKLPGVTADGAWFSGSLDALIHEARQMVLGRTK